MQLAKIKRVLSWVEKTYYATLASFPDILLVWLVPYNLNNWNRHHCWWQEFKSVQHPCHFYTHDNVAVKTQQYREAGFCWCSLMTSTYNGFIVPAKLIHCWLPTSSYPYGGYRNNMGVAHSWCHSTPRPSSFFVLWLVFHIVWTTGIDIIVDGQWHLPQTTLMSWLRLRLVLRTIYSTSREVTSGISTLHLWSTVKFFTTSQH